MQDAGLELQPLPRSGFTFYSSSQSDFKTPKRGSAAHKKEQQEHPPSVTPSSDTPSELITTAFEFTGADMELFHHFLTSEELGASKSPETMHSRLPRLGFSFHYILQLILAFSGFHLARIQEHESKYYFEAERHYATTLRKVSAAVPLLDHHNCHALYMAAILIFVCSFAKGPQPDEFLAFAMMKELVHFFYLWVSGRYWRTAQLACWKYTQNIQSVTRILALCAIESLGIAIR